MKPQRSSTTQHNTLQGDDIAMGIDKDAIVHIMNVVTDLYADPELACIREYATNAWDAHVEAGITRPIEVELPTALKPSLTIRDFGAGLTHDDIREIYSQYGASTKRGTNDAVGMLGLGCKSALAYADQFTVTSRADGNMITVSVSRDERGAGTMTVLDRGPCDIHESGTEVVIPTPPRTAMAAKADDFFSYWPEGSVTINGSPAAPAEGFQLTDDILIQNKMSGYGISLFLLMGNVRYPAPDEYDHPAVNNLEGAKEITVRVPIGTVSFAPSREALLDTPAVRGVLDESCQRIGDAILDKIRRGVERAPDKPSALKAFIGLREACGVAHVAKAMWHGKPIPQKFGYHEYQLPKDADERDRPQIMWVGPHRAKYEPDNTNSMHTGLSLGHIAQAKAWVVGFSNKSWSKPMRLKLDAYLETHGIEDADLQRFMLVAADEAPGNDWLDLPVFKWEDIRKWRDPNAEVIPGGRGRYAGTYECVEGHELPDGRFTFNLVTQSAEWIAKQELPIAFATDGKYSFGDITARRLWGKYLMVALPQTRADKFQRLFPDAVPSIAAQRKQAEAYWRRLMDAERRAAAYGYEPGNFLPLLSAALQDRMDEIEDPALHDIFEARTLWDGVSKTWGLWQDMISASAVEEAQTGLIDWRTQYPLLPKIELWSIDGAALDHLITYVNTTYREEQK